MIIYLKSGPVYKDLDNQNHGKNIWRFTKTNYSYYVKDCSRMTI